MKKTKLLSWGIGMVMSFLPLSTTAQSELYPNHFELGEVTLLDGPFRKAMLLNNQVLLQYDVDRLLTPYVRQAGLSATTDTNDKYYHWTSLHPSFTNWGDNSFNLDGHVGGHYLSALALAYAANDDPAVKAQMKERMGYMIGVMKDCQDAYDTNTQGLYGFIGGQPINDVWTVLYNGTITAYTNKGGWVPFYCQHKILAGLRDAYLYGKSDVAKELFRKLADWSVNVVNKVSAANMETLLNVEHGGMNESLLDAYQLFGDEKYLTAAKKFSHKTMLNGMQTLNTTFLDGKHANTQVPKYIGFERVSEQDAAATNYATAARNFWQDVAENRTVCIGGNSVNEHFLARSNSNRYIDQLDGPESCNSNNMLKLSEMLADKTHDAKYADFYEYTMWNHILSTQDPTTGGYVYFTTLRPQGYRIYSQVNQGMWCCVGTGMENHSKYGHFIYTHDGTNTLYVNLFTASRLVSDDFIITQETQYPYEQQTKLTVGKGGNYNIAIRHPWWTTDGYAITVNGEPQTLSVEQGKASYAVLSRTWSEGDVIVVSLPMTLRTADCPNYTDYIAFEYGPMLLGAQTTASSAEDAEATGLAYEALQNEYAGEGRMDHAPGSRATAKNLMQAPLLIGDRADVLSKIQVKDLSKLTFVLDASRPDVQTYQWNKLLLRPFYDIHHSRYMCYWYQQTAENFANSDMAKKEAENESLAVRTLDFVAPGEQQSEAGHEYNYSSDSSTGTYQTESYRDAKVNGHIQYTLYNNTRVKDSLSVMLRFTTADKGRKASLLVDGEKIADITIPSTVKGADVNGFYNVEIPIPAALAVDTEGKGKAQFVVRLAANAGTICPGLYFLRLMRGYNPSANAYQFVSTDWKTGDANRVVQSKISYDTERNIIHVAQTGTNNVCLQLDYNNCDYTIGASQKYMVIKGRNLRMNAGSAYLWWLNGSNHGTQVAPTLTKEVTQRGQTYQVLAWDMTRSGLYENFSGDRPNITMGQTIFGLTAASAAGADIYDVAFVEDPGEVAYDVRFQDWAPTPPMGWNSWDCYGPSVKEQQVYANANYMKDNGLLELGWNYVIVDIRWYTNDTGFWYNTSAAYTMDKYGRYMPNVTRFPSAKDGVGFKALADSLHKMGFKFGIHIMRGVPMKAVQQKCPILGTDYTCDQIYNTDSICTWLKDNYTVDCTKPGAQEYYNSLLNLYASWGVDFLKVDDLSRPYHDGEIGLIRHAIDQCGRDIVFSMSPGATALEKWESCQKNANMWRMMDDLWDNWSDISKVFTLAKSWNQYRKPGNYPDCDMLPLGQIRLTNSDKRWTNLTHNEQQTMMTLWSLFKSPLFFAGDFTYNDEWTNHLISNEEMIAVDQLSENNRLVSDDGIRVVWAADLAHPALSNQSSTYAGLFNLGGSDQWIRYNEALFSTETISLLTDGYGQEVECDIPEGSKVLALVVDDAGDNWNYDHGDWINPVAILEDGTSYPLEQKDMIREDYSGAYFKYIRYNRNINNNGKLKVNGVEYDRGFACSANAMVLYRLPAGAKKFTGFCGIDDTGRLQSGATSSMKFLVFAADPTKRDVCNPSFALANSGLVSRTYQAEGTTVEADITGAEKLYLVVTNAGDGFDYDHADWINPVLIDAEGNETPLTTIQYDSSVTDWKNLSIYGKNVDNGPLVVGGQTYADGIGTNSNSVITYTLPEGHRYVRFRSMVGYDEGVKSAPKGVTMEFLVYTSDPKGSNEIAIPLDLVSLGFDADAECEVYDIWNNEVAGRFYGSQFQPMIPQHGCGFYRITPTGITAVKGVSLDNGSRTGKAALGSKGAWYNLNGQRIDTPQRGMNVQRGRKVIVK
ncbi:MAG: glycoside hydrolase family 127 protein [Prevotella sp.]|nr:glycoside hydrolase family 127 protein [Prevotella sp.]